MVMTSVLRGLGLGAFVLSVGLLAGCTSDSGVAGEPPASKPKQKSSAAGSTLDEERYSKQLAEVLGTGIAQLDDSFVESGSERVSDGIHTYSTLSPGKSYSLVVVCAGKGKVDLSAGVKPPIRQTLPCDGVPFTRRIKNAPGTVEIDATGMAGSAGMVAWRVSTLDG
ncbi:hypothetical protein ACFWVC_24015 [Streptomyces sp. NPDC058691]|uniref:hypothetical protein n=1 Tax=Streptomyces sp. NPDC058691 TaxID=3346601 RepID=UPI003663DA8E